MKNTNTYNIIGLMSGTSLDGVDLAYCKFEYQKKWQFEIRKAGTFSYPSEILMSLKRATSLSETEINDLDNQLGTFYASLIRDFIVDHPIDFIASHGHTIFHQPEKGLTFQIGNGHVMHELTNIPVINNFRAKDVTIGGQGAPLVPIGDKHLFGAYDYCINLGGIANISFEEKGLRKAFDISPCNMLMNQAVSRLNLLYDNKGELASQGQIVKTLLDKWNGLDYFSRNLPKSLGFEWVSDHYFNDLKDENYHVKDLLRTIVEHVSVQIANTIKARSKILFTGGGAKNSFLMEQLELKLQSNQTIVKPNEKLIDYKEALIFAFLGVLRERGEINVLSSVTGASQDTCSGDLYGF